MRRRPAAGVVVAVVPALALALVALVAPSGDGVGVGVAVAKKRRPLTAEERAIVSAKNIAVVRVMKVSSPKATNSTPPIVEVQVEEVLRGISGRFDVVWAPPPSGAKGWATAPLPVPKEGTALVVVIDRDAKGWSIPACCRWPYSEERKRMIAEIKGSPEKEVTAWEQAMEERLERDLEEERAARAAAEKAAAEKAQKVATYRNKADLVLRVRRGDMTALDRGLALDLEVLEAYKGKPGKVPLHLVTTDEIVNWNLAAPVTLDRELVIFCKPEGNHLRLIADDAVFEATEDVVAVVR